MAAVQASLPGNAVVVPGHGRPVDASALTFTIDYLDALVTGVQESVEAGMDLESAQGAVTLEEFQGYAAWGFAHSMINLPMTFTELSEN